MNKIRKFWDWTNTDNIRTLRIDGAIAEESWLNDEITPKQFKSELNSGNRDIEVWLNSPGGDTFAASQIYNMLKDYKGKVTVKIDGLAASAASVIAMSGDEVLMSPVSILMLHDPSTIAIGNSEEIQKAIAMLSEIKESIINAYQLKTGLSRIKIANMMDQETWMNARKAVELGFADGILFSENTEKVSNQESLIFSRMAVTNSVLEKLKTKTQSNFAGDSHKKDETNPRCGCGNLPLESLYQRLELLKRR